MGNIKKGTLTKKGKPTRLAVELYLKYFELGGKPTDKNINKLIGERIQEIMGWKNGEGLVCLMWGLHPNTTNCKKHNYREPMVTAKNLALEIFDKCSK
jgi:hypothetical protein